MLIDSRRLRCDWTDSSCVHAGLQVYQGGHPEEFPGDQQAEGTQGQEARPDCFTQGSRGNSPPPPWPIHLCTRVVVQLQQSVQLCVDPLVSLLCIDRPQDCADSSEDMPWDASIIDQSLCNMEDASTPLSLQTAALKLLARSLLIVQLIAS